MTSAYQLRGTGLTVADAGVKTAGAVTAGLIGSGSIVVGGAAITAAAIPLIGVAVLGVTLALNYIFNRPTQKYKVITTDIVNQLEPQLKANVAAYLAGPRTLLSQAAALQNFDRAWAWLISKDACGNPGLDFPGKHCIEDRQAGGKWDWFSYYRNPIAEDTQPQQMADAAAAQAQAQPLSVITAPIADAIAQVTGSTPHLAELALVAAIVLILVAA